MHNLKRENQVILLMITDGNKWHYLDVKHFYALYRKIKSKHDRDFHYLNGLHSFRTENKLKKHDNVRKDHDFCYVELLKKDNEILK